MKKIAALAGIALLVGTSVAACSVVPNEICLCEVTYYNADCDQDQAGLEAIEHSILEVPCPKEGVNDGGVVVSGPTYDKMEKAAKDKVISWTGIQLNPPSYNPVTHMVSFIRVLGCKQFVRDATRIMPEPKPSDAWFKKNTKKRGKTLAAGCDDIDVDPDTQTYTVYEDCTVNDVELHEGMTCGGDVCTPETTPASDAACGQCMADKCCADYNACINDSTSVCQCLMGCSDLKAYPNCDSACYASSLTVAQVRECITCLSVCPALQNPPVPPKPPTPPNDGEGGSTK